jgi:alkanesulfonate monooxygenase SsuD/methylene tetrahydromethanopterin reductase-like flavin-dependent oxidoreductase (luciferase family)
MWRNSADVLGQEMFEVIDELDSAGYYSVLFPIESIYADYMPQAINSITNNQKIKYMIPVRPYLLSPQYLAMLSAGIEKIAPGRTIFNFIHGHLSDEEDLDGVIASSVDFSSKDNRRKHLEDFISTLKNIKIHDEPDFSECLISGGSQQILEIADRLKVDVATTYFNYLETYKDVHSRFSFDRIYTYVCILPRETDEEAAAVKLSIGSEIDPGGVLCGSYESIAKSLDELEKLRVTDLLISPAFDGGAAERQHLHRFAKYMASRSVRVNVDDPHF